MRFRKLIAGIVLVALAAPASATVFINEIFINPAGSGTDDFYEYVELVGTPGMKLDGYGFAAMNGYLRKLHPLGSISSADPGYQEIDEFFALDGLEIGPNGILVIGIGIDIDYPNMLSDTNFRPDWEGAFLGGSGPGPIWNGGLDSSTNFQNDGSNTFMLVRHRAGDVPGNCPAPPCGDLRWGKDICHDCELITPVDTTICQGGFNPGDPCSTGADCVQGTCVPGQADQWGDGNLDKGQTNGLSGTTIDLKGASTLADISDDLEIVDEVSYEDQQGWEYDEDDRHVDSGSTRPGLSLRRVHELDDPQGFGPDVLVRVDYRTKGPGWTPATGGTGELPGGNNWQDTATEQWIRGESILSSGRFYCDIGANADPNAIQPYRTFVPLWLNDGSGSEFNFTSPFTYEIMAGRVNPLSVSFIPGDSDRDGDCDAADINKIAAVFGDDDWIFSNSFDVAPETDSGDPATQTRPWDVDASGDNGIEASDLQWTLNFQGSTTGRIVGMRYDSTTPSASGVVLNPNTGVTCAITASATNGCGRSLSSLLIGDTVQLTVSGQITAGANLTAGAENGIMQFAHDVAISSGGVLQILSIEPLGSFGTTRPALQAQQGVSGDLGVKLVNGYSTSFTQGLSSAANLYRVTFKAVAAGSTSITVGAATSTRFAASTPRGVKIGHTRNTVTNGPNDISTVSIGDPATTSYPSAIGVTVTSGMVGNVNNDSATDFGDIPFFVEVLLGNDTDPGRQQRSDLNCDLAWNGLDVQGMIDAVLP